ncbi:tetratricopeptide repeat protein [Neptunicella sp.]|uniref:tetratricopeptide repeat protein n=1 Tax=Neptunicella sp. TaxID=2125986 RepID=UPI003F694BAF
MSVINKMLQDLDYRQNQGSTNAVYTPPAKRNVLLWLAISLLLMVLIAYAVITWLNHSSSAKPVAQKTVQATPVIDSPELPVKSAEPVVRNSNPRTGQSLPVSQPSVGIDDSVVMDDSSEASVASSDSESATQRQSRRIEQDDIPQDDIVQPAVEKSTPAASLTIKPVVLTKQQRIEQLQSRIQAALAEPDNNRAIELLKQLISVDPEHSKARQKLANLFNQQGKIIDAQQVLEGGLALDNQDVALRMMLARLEVQQGRPEQALLILNEYQPSAVQHSDFYALLANIADQQGDQLQVLKAYSILSRAEPHNGKWWLGLAVAADRLAQYELAIDAYQHVLNSAQLQPSVQDFAQQRITLLRR